MYMQHCASSLFSQQVYYSDTVHTAQSLRLCAHSYSKEALPPPQFTMLPWKWQLSQFPHLPHLHTGTSGRRRGLEGRRGVSLLYNTVLCTQRAQSRQSSDKTVAWVCACSSCASGDDT